MNAAFQCCCQGIRLAAVVAMILSAPRVSAQSPSRVGQFESSVGGQYQSGVSTTFENSSVELDVRNTGLIAVGFGYHFHEHFAANLNMAFGGTTLTLDGPLADDRIKQDAYLFNGNANIDYNVLKGAFTPIITAGVGWNGIETNIPGSDPEYICYPGYPYWWCGYDYPTYSTFSFSSNVGVGFRWNVNDDLFVKGLASSRERCWSAGISDRPIASALPRSSPII